MKMPTMQPKMKTMFTDEIAFLQDIALAWNFARLEAMSIDRERFFKHKIEQVVMLTRNFNLRKMANEILKNEGSVAFSFDQFFYFMFDKMPSPDASKVNKQIQKALNGSMKRGKNKQAKLV